MALTLLIDPRTRGAFFDAALAVAEAEVRALFPGCTVEVERHATLDLLRTDLPEEAAPRVARLACVHGIFVGDASGLRLVDQAPDFVGPESLVTGAKYRGKTNELVTQLAINLALRFAEVPAGKPTRLLDPMAGRGTTLLWALRYGLDAVGIEADPRALDDLHRHVKRQTKLHRIKHEANRGFVGRKTSSEVGRFVEYLFGERRLKLVAGDTRDLGGLLGEARFTHLVCDVPYGVQHTGPKGDRDPIDVLAAAAPGWVARMRPGGALVISFNSLLPKRRALIELFEGAGLQAQPFEAPHRMSESILRDLVVFTRPL